MKDQLLEQWTKEKVSRGTKCFSAQSQSKYPGSYPVNFLKWLQSQGWWGDRRIHLCAGGVVDPDSDRVDIQKVTTTSSKPHHKGRLVGNKSIRGIEYETTANIIADARDTGLESESYNWVGIDPPYSADLAEKFYDTREHFSGIDAFVNEGWRLLEPGGLLMTFSYATPSRPGSDADLVAMWGIYQQPPVRWMTCLSVWRKQGEGRPQGLDRWIE